MGLPLLKIRYTVEEYLALDRESHVQGGVVHGGEFCSGAAP